VRVIEPQSMAEPATASQASPIKAYPVPDIDQLLRRLPRIPPASATDMDHNPIGMYATIRAWPVWCAPACARSPAADRGRGSSSRDRPDIRGRSCREAGSGSHAPPRHGPNRCGTRRTLFRLPFGVSITTRSSPVFGSKVAVSDRMACRAVLVVIASGPCGMTSFFQTLCASARFPELPPHPRD
jgi:hypothetical protein